MSKTDLVEIDARVAVEVMGQRRTGDCTLGDQNCGGEYSPIVGRWPCLPPYSTDTSADWTILKVARGWRHKRREVFCQALRDIWGERCGGNTGYPSVFGILYEPGDYSRAALKATEVTDGD